MKSLTRIFLSMLILLLLSTPILSLAESDYEEGDGWIYQDGTLTITGNDGLKDFEVYEQDPQTGNWTRNHTVTDVKTLTIGKNVSELSIEMYDWNILNPTTTIIETGNTSFLNINGWIINTKTNTLFGASNMAQMRTKKIIDDIPNDIEHIGSRAFSYYTKLQQIQLPRSVISIGERAFENCDSLTSLELPDRVISIGDSAFYNCDKLSNIKFGANLKQIGYSALNACESLEDVNLEDTRIQILSKISFGSCNHLKLLRLPATVTKIESQALNGCHQLNTLVIASDDIVIENSAFGYCDHLSKVVFTKGTPQTFGETLFGETGKTADGKGYISNSSDRRGDVIPYPTLYYTAAYADEWAPNGETEWNGYPIQQISQEELDAILAEARGEEPPEITNSPAPTVVQQVETPVPEETKAVAAPATGVEGILLAAIGIAAIAVAMVLFARVRKTKR